MSFSELKNQTIVAIHRNEESIALLLKDKRWMLMYHEQDCCESVAVENIDGDLSDLVNTELLLAEESVQTKDPSADNEDDDSSTWTFYRLATIKGDVSIRWLGKSNGYYSESVSCEWQNKPWVGPTTGVHFLSPT